MPNASEAEIAAASARWFAFLRLVDRIGSRLDREVDAEPASLSDVQDDKPTSQS